MRVEGRFAAGAFFGADFFAAAGVFGLAACLLVLLAEALLPVRDVFSEGFFASVDFFEAAMHRMDAGASTEDSFAGRARAVS